MDAIVFDWDGTLVDSLPAIFDANLRVLEEYGMRERRFGAVEAKGR